LVYAKQHRRIEQIAAKLAKTATTVAVVDATGIGRPQLELIRGLLRAVHVRTVGVQITSGAVVGVAGDDFTVPKKDLISASQVALERGCLMFNSQLPLADVLVEELRAYRYSTTAGNEVMGNYRADSAHDDLVLAVSLAVWWAARMTSTGPVGVYGPPRRSNAPSVSFWGTKGPQSNTTANHLLGKRA
jgi:hypothetical protein